MFSVGIAINSNNKKCRVHHPNWVKLSVCQGCWAFNGCWIEFRPSHCPCFRMFVDPVNGVCVPWFPLVSVCQGPVKVFDETLNYKPDVAIRRIKVTICDTVSVTSTD